MAGAMLDEDGKVIYEKKHALFRGGKYDHQGGGDNPLTLQRIEAPADAVMSVANAFPGTWAADLPEGKEVFEGVTMTDKSDGTYSYKVGDMAVENRDLALKDTLVSLSDEGEIEPFPFVTIDENNLDATGPEGKTARFARHAEGEKAA